MQVVRKHKRRRALLAIFFPAAIVLFLIGWSLTWIDRQKQPRKAHAEPVKDHVHLEAITIEKPTEITR